MNKKQGKITVKHYLNRRAKVKFIGREKYFPLYIQIIVAGHKAQIKSKIQDYIAVYMDTLENTYANRELTSLIGTGYFSQTFLDRIFYENDFPVATLLRNEITILRKIILENDPFGNPDFSLVNFSQQYAICVTDIDAILNRSITQKYLDQLENVKVKSSTEEIGNLRFFLLNFVRWDLRFLQFYRSALDIFPEQMKKLENHFSEKLRTHLSVFLSWSSASESIRERIGKEERGLLPGINYFDWKEEVRNLLSEELKPVLGEEKSRIYVSIIDELILEELEKEKSSK